MLLPLNTHKLPGLVAGFALFVLSLTGGLLSGQAMAEGVKPYEARVTRVHDGDTVWVQPLGGGRYRKLRLDGLDAPELCQTGGVASRDALAALVLSKTITVRERASDDYGRGLSRLLLLGEDVGAQLVLAGHAWSYRWRLDPGPYAREEASARSQGKGLFSGQQVEMPRDFRKRHGPCDGPR